MSRRQLFTVTFLLVFLLLLWQLGLILSPFFSPILWAVILATTTYPLYIRLLACVDHSPENRREERTENKSQLPQEQKKHQQKGHGK